MLMTGFRKRRTNNSKKGKIDNLKNSLNSIGIGSMQDC